MSKFSMNTVIRRTSIAAIAAAALGATMLVATDASARGFGG